MDRRIEGVRQSRIQPAAGPTGASGGQQTRLRVDPNFDVFSKGLQSAYQGVEALGRVKQYERQEDRQRNLVKASTKVKTWAEKEQTYLTRKPNTAYQTLEDRYTSDEEYRELFDEHFGEIEDPEIRAQAEADARAAYNRQVAQRVAEKERDEKLYEVYETTDSQIRGILDGSPEDIERNLNNLVAFAQGETYNLSGEDIGEIFIKVQESMLEESPDAQATIAEVLAKNKQLPPTVRARLQEIQQKATQLTAVKERQLRSEMWRKEIMPMLQADGLEATLAAYEADDERGSRWASFFDSSQLTAAYNGIQKQKKEQDTLTGLMRSLHNGTAAEYMAEHPEGFSAKDQRRAVAQMQEIIRQSPEFKNLPPEKQEDALEDYTLDLFQQNHMVPRFAKDQLADTFHLPNRPYASDKEIPPAFKESIRLAGKLYSRGQLHETLGNDQENQEWVALIHMTQSGMSQSEALNNMITVQEQGDYGFKPPVGEEKANLLNALKSEIRASSLGTHERNRAFTLYSVYKAKGLTNDKAIKAAVERVAQTTVVAEGQTYPDAFFRNDNGTRMPQEEFRTRIQAVKEVFLGKTKRYTERDIKVQPLPGGILAVADVNGNVLMNDEGDFMYLYPNQFKDPNLLTKYLNLNIRESQIKASTNAASAIGIPADIHSTR